MKETQYRIIVCGSRHHNEPWKVMAELQAAMEAVNKSAHGELIIVHGNSGNADTAAGAWVSTVVAASGTRRIKAEPHPADWAKHGNAAGPIRNREMAKAGADICFAFWDGESRGTWDMIKQAVKHGIKVCIFPWSKE